MLGTQTKPPCSTGGLRTIFFIYNIQNGSIFTEEQTSPGPGAAPKEPRKLFYFLLAPLLACGLCLVILHLRQKPRLVATTPAAGAAAAGKPEARPLPAAPALIYGVCSEGLLAAEAAADK